VRLLWIDDDGNLLRSQIRRLTEKGYKVSVASNVDAAWEILHSTADETNGIILDIMMGTGELLHHENTKGGLITGEHFLRRLREEETLSGVKVIIYTVTDNDSTKDYASEIGVSYYSKQDYPGKALVDIVVREFGAP
jgi:DNA-binding response OmpR family regulator